MRTVHQWRSHDGLLLQQHTWPADGHTKATVMIIHGLGDHGGRYHRVAEQLASQGWAVTALDQRGHGASHGPRANAHVRDHLKDTGAAVTALRRTQPGHPLFLLGHSWGGMLALAYALQNQASLDGLVLCSTAARPTPTSATTMALGRLLAKTAPGTGTRRLPLHQTTRDPQALADFYADPLVFRHRVRARMGFESLVTMNETRQKLSALLTPTLLLHGTADRIAPVEYSKHLYNALTSTDRTLKLYDGLHHQLFNEPERETVLDDLTTWLSSRI
ncbi:alpha/beta hydrolase [Kribbella antibiotica]|uniref:Alpha/beta hydrolase n=1 Tax=Kribbella antibiotica TaxID=190195 RepID=A0A4R4ZGM1_9ACTN|nr:alpha/beta hydrolase [Kribbella antibiotica]TDD57683.1 alpha/beta hydrolase [Kribbella antibiotica]